jgi:hypothetical protein
MRRTCLILMAALALSPPAWALRCGNNLVVEGDTKYDVYRRCGNPDFQDTRTVYRSVRIRGSGLGQPGLDVYETIPVQIDEWTYNFGPDRFIELITFENGRIINIRPLDYGD